MKTVREIQRQVAVFSEGHNLTAPAAARVLDLTSEVGEVAKEILKMTSYGNKELVLNEEVAMELGDVLYSLLTVANVLDIDLATAFDAVMEKYEQRLQQSESGSIGSENE